MEDVYRKCQTMSMCPGDFHRVEAFMQMTILDLERTKQETRQKQKTKTKKPRFYYFTLSLVPPQTFDIPICILHL